MSRLYNLEEAAEIAKEPREIVEIIAANTDNMTDGEWHHVQGKGDSTLVVTELGAKQIGDLIRELASMAGKLESELRGYADSDEDVARMMAQRQPDKIPTP